MASQRRRRSAGRLIWTPKVAETAKSMWAAGDSASAIATALGIFIAMVRVKARREGWPRPPHYEAMAKEQSIEAGKKGGRSRSAKLGTSIVSAAKS